MGQKFGNLLHVGQKFKLKLNIFEKSSSKSPPFQKISTLTYWIIKQMLLELFHAPNFVVGQKSSSLQDLKVVRVKICQKLPKYAPGSLFGGLTKKKIQNVLTHQYERIL